jgi:hypothetical protein
MSTLNSRSPETTGLPASRQPYPQRSLRHLEKAEEAVLTKRHKNHLADGGLTHWNSLEMNVLHLPRT